MARRNLLDDEDLFDHGWVALIERSKIDAVFDEGVGELTWTRTLYPNGVPYAESPDEIDPYTPIDGVCVDTTHGLIASVDSAHVTTVRLDGTDGKRRGDSVGRIRIGSPFPSKPTVSSTIIFADDDILLVGTSSGQLLEVHCSFDATARSLYEASSAVVAVELPGGNADELRKCRRRNHQCLVGRTTG